MAQRELSSFRSLVLRIRREYEEMPGLHLTLQQACRLWGLGPETCGALLDTLVREGFLVQTRRGAFARA
jgi:DNA-binding IclR family transcriptional regulator